MFDRLRSARALLGLTLVSALSSAPALAGSPSASEISAARSLGRDGIKAAEAGDCQQAVEKLERAEQLFHAPTILGRLAECQVALGHLVVGLENLERVVREELDPKAPAAFKAAKARARKVLEKNRNRVARLKVVVEGPPARSSTVMVDGVAVAAALIGGESPVDPGEHEISGSAAGFVTATAKVTLAEGATAETKLTLQPVPAEKPSALVEKPIATSETPAGDLKLASRPEPSRPGRALAYVGLGAGVAGIALGSTFGILAMNKQAGLEKVCVDKLCPASAQADINTLKVDGNVATAGFVAGGVLLAAGAVLWFVLAPPPESTAVESGQAQTFEVRPTLLPGYAGIAGKF